MSEHILEWLGAYLDGELPVYRRRQMEEHVAHCLVCKAELESLQRLSQVLQADPLPNEFSSPQNFSSRIELLLPRLPSVSPTRRALKIAWWSLPFAVLGAYLFVQVVFSITGWISAGGALGFVGDSAKWLTDSSSQVATWQEALQGWGIAPPETTVRWALWAEAFGRSSIQRLSWQVPLALLYLAWLALSVHRLYPRFIEMGVLTQNHEI